MAEDRVRTAELMLSYKSANIGEHVKSFKYIDHAHGKADEIEVTLEDREHLWQGPWYPGQGEQVKAELVAKDWFDQGKNLRLSCGTFTLDEPELSGPPDVVTFKAISTFVATSLRGEPQTREWRNTSLKGIAKKLAKKNKLELFWGLDDPSEAGRLGFHPPKNVKYKLCLQRQEADSRFLRRLCEAAGLNFKVSHKQLIVFEDHAKTYLTIARDPALSAGWLSNYKFRQKTDNVYRKCEVRHHNPINDQRYYGAYKPEKPPKVGSVLRIRERVESNSAAKRLAKAEYYKANKVETTVILNLAGHPGLVAGVGVNLTGFGRFDGTFIIDEATHNSARSGGYKTDVTARKLILGV